MKRWSLTSNVTPTPTSDSHSSPRLTYPTLFSRLSTAILTFLEAVEPNLQRHPYANIRFTSLSSPYLPQHFFPPLYLYFNCSRSGGAEPPTSPLRQLRIRIRLLASPTLGFFPDSTPIFTLHQAVEPYLQRHPYTTTSSPPYAKMLDRGWPHTTYFNGSRCSCWK